LIVEDKEIELQGNKNDLDAINAERRGKFGIASFDIHLARALDEAEQSLSKTNGLPYDLMLLDLGIPITKDQPNTDTPENGEQLLAARERGAVKEIIVTSVFTDFERVARAFRSGVKDYIGKPYKTAQLQTVVLECWKRLLEKESGLLLGEKRVEGLVPYAEKGLAHRFTNSFSTLVRTVTHSADDIERYMHERYGLDRRKDAQDLFFKSLTTQEECLTRAKQEWLELKGQVQADESHGAASVEKLLRAIFETLLPCLIVKNLVLDFSDEGAAQVLSFDNDVQAVLKEIIVGAASVLDDFNEKEQVIEVKVANANGQVQVTFIDHLAPIPASDARLINEGSSISPDRRFGREWGLSVVQHIAMRGGGRLQIEPQARGNHVTYLVPSAS
jgi:CheY-like chemotaxis protein